MSNDWESAVRGMRISELSANPAWSKKVVIVLKELCSLGSGSRLDAKQINEIVAERYPHITTNTTASIGPIMARAAEAGLIVDTGKWRAHHGNPRGVKVWRPA